VSADRESPCGSTFVETSPSPCFPLGVPPVDAPPQPLQKQAERARTDEVGVRDEVRFGNHDTGHAERLQLLVRGDPVELVPDDVARRQQLRSRRQQCRGGRGVLSRRLRERVAEPCEPFRAQLERIDHALVDAPQGPRHPDLLCLVVRLLLLLGVLLEARLEVGLLQPGRDQLVRELDAELA
jgi:hypothetical protein